MKKIRSDVIIWDEILDGSSTAWEELVRKYQSLVYTVVSRSGLSYHDAADCFQNVWVTLYKHRKRISNPERLSAWLVTTARREALKHIRQARNLSRVDERDLYRNPNPLPDEELEALELQAELELHIQNLDVRCQKLIHAIFFSPKNHTYQDLAAMLGISINALGPAKRRCLNRLRKIIEEGGSPDARISKKQAL